MPPPAGSALIAYRNALQILDDETPLTAEQALEILCVRDALQHELARAAIAPHRLQRIAALDTQLKQNAQRLTNALGSDTMTLYRNSLLQRAENWWWYLDEQLPPHSLDRYDWVFNGLSFTSWTVSIALLINIASRFFSGGPDITGAIAVIVPTLLALLQAKSNLTDTGQQGFDGLLKQLKIPSFLQAEAKFASTFLLLIGMLCFWAALPKISERYSLSGLAGYRVGNLSDAESNYKRAIALDPNNVNAHYNLGRLYEDWWRFDEAKQEYRIAVGSDVARAYNNLARLYILDKNYPAAMSLLLREEELVKQQLSFPKDKQVIRPEDQYNLAKNLGWVRFEQNRDAEAETFLRQAILIAKDPTVSKILPNRASAHCILAQVLNRHKKPGAIDQWQQCIALGNPKETPEEDTWLHLANQALTTSQNKTP
jgi:tetratricopeptide (TPR) repeat protein